MDGADRGVVAVGPDPSTGAYPEYYVGVAVPIQIGEGRPGFEVSRQIDGAERVCRSIKLGEGTAIVAEGANLAIAPRIAAYGKVEVAVPVNVDPRRRPDIPRR
jgi:hypothetical protein